MFTHTLLLCSVVAVSNAFVHNVQVGSKDGALVYTPPVTIAKPGDFVNFIFSPKNHTVTKSSFDDPCTPLQDGFNSGFMPVAANLTSGFPTFTIPVVDTKPIWFYCQQGAGTNASHCSKGMVGAINPSAAKTFDAFKQKALATAGQTTPSTSTTSMHHTVNVSDVNGTLAFFPPITDAKPGDSVTFNFFPKNHTVTQSTFNDPCTPAPMGFNSGFQPVGANLTEPHSAFTISIHDTNPIWFYCQQGANTNASHCGKGMVGAINTDQDKFNQYKAKALDIGQALGASSTTPPTIHQVQVSNENGSLIYTPSVTYAKVGEIVRFTFFPKNHTVTQSSFDQPCLPLENGLTSGFRPVSANVTSQPFDITVKDDKPIWLHCEQAAGTNATHCGRGMVAAINPTADKTFDAFKQKALNVGAALGAQNSPPQPGPVTHKVQVGGDDGSLVYVPSVTIAHPGDFIQFTFKNKNHTVTQSSFSDPCTKLEDGFDSDFTPVAVGTTDNFPTFTIPVVDSFPKWFYCRQGAKTNASHCGKGMVYAINPSVTNNFDAFRHNALQIGLALGAVNASALN